MKNLTTDTPDHDPKADQALYDLLTKKAEDTKTETDEDKSTVGTTPDPSDEDLERPSGDIDAPWGEKPSPEVVAFSKEPMRKFKENRERFLEKHFDSKKSADKAAQGLMSQQLACCANGDFETSSPLLSEQAKRAIGK